MEHAHWIEENNGDDYISYTCSNCGWNFATIDWELDITNFEHCPHCVAKMNEDNKYENL